MKPIKTAKTPPPPHLNRSGILRQKQFRNLHVLTVRFNSSTNFFFHLKIIK